MKQVVWKWQRRSFALIGSAILAGLIVGTSIAAEFRPAHAIGSVDLRLK